MGCSHSQGKVCQLFDTRFIVSRGLDTVASVLQPFVAARFAVVSPEISDWTEIIRHKDLQNGRAFEAYNPGDLLVQLRAITERLGTLEYPFNGVLNRQASGYAGELRRVRNRWAHGEEFTTEEAYRALDTAQGLVTEVGDESAVQLIVQLKTYALRALHDPAEAVISEPAQGVALPVVDAEAAQHVREPVQEIVDTGVDARAPEASSLFRIEPVVTEVLSYALAHAAVAIVQDVKVFYEGPELRGLSLEVSAESQLGPLSEAKVVIVDLDGKGEATVRNVNFKIDPARMLSIDTQMTGYVRFVLSDSAGETLADERAVVEILAANQWVNRPVGLGLELIAAFVQPNSPEIPKLAGEVSDRLGQLTGRDALDGYQSEHPDRVDAMVRAAYEAIQARGIRYAEPPASWGMSGQKVRTPEEVLGGRLGTCLDTTVVLAAVLEEIGINSTLWFTPGHVFLGYWRRESALDVPAEEDVSEAMNYVQLGMMGLVETTAIAAGDSFQSARRRPSADHLEKGASHFSGVTDILQARKAGIYPLPSRTMSESGEITVHEYAVAAALPPLEYLPVDLDVKAGHHDDVPDRIARWKNALLDLSLRNRLINFTDSSGFSLAVPGPTLPEFEDDINSNKEVTLIPSDDLTSIDTSRGVRDGRDLPEEIRAQRLREKQEVFVSLSKNLYQPQLQKLAHRARTEIEETGANNLYLALGMLRWQLDGRELRSPLILVPVRLVGTARSRYYRLVIDEAGESTPNYSLLEKLRTTHGLEIPGLRDPARDESGIDLFAALTATRVAISRARLPFTVDESSVLGILQFTKYRLWRDVDESWQEFVKNPLVDHLVNTPTAAFTDPVSEPSSIDLDIAGSELPVPADASQLEAVIDAAHGRTFVLEGPPGTGKSQTITNLIAHSMSKGKKVLFVAEKRAALDVVQDRLVSVGLGSLTLDLHDKSARPNAVREQILAAIDVTATPDTSGLENQREVFRSSVGRLRDYAYRLHGKNQLGFSFYSACDRRLAADEDGAELDIPVTFLSGASEENAGRVRTVLHNLPDKAQLARPALVHPWGFVGAAERRGTPADIEAAARNFDHALVRTQNLGLPVELLDRLSSPAQVDLWARLAGLPRFDLHAIDAMGDALATGVVQELVVKLEQLVDNPPEWMSRVSPRALALDVPALHALAVEADASGMFGRKKRQLGALAAFGETLLMDPSDFDPKAVSATAAGVLATWSQVNSLRDELRRLPIPQVDQTWNPFITAEAEKVKSRLDVTAWITEMLTDPNGVLAPVQEDIRRDYAGTDPDLERSGTLSTYADGWRTLIRAVGREPGHGGTPLQTWAAPEGMVTRWHTTRSGRSSGDQGIREVVHWTEFLDHIEPVRHFGLERAHFTLRHGQVPAYDAVLAFDKGLAASAIIERRQVHHLDEFDAATHNRTIQRFTASAAEIRKELPQELPATIMATRTVDPNFTQGRMGELQRQLSRKRGGMSVRELFHEYSDIILDLAPCVLMSPESVARFFPARSGIFDIVVFDEASQIRVADAVGAMGRGRSVVVVGDSKQMPPTSVMESRHSFDDEETPEAIIDEESILTECVQARVARKWLSWHYRSQDEVLISFSNQAYYENRLSSFPAPLNPSSGMRNHGISLVRTDGKFNRTRQPEATGEFRTNRVEAEAIVGDVARRFAASPQRTPSVGVVTFNQQQRTLIESLLRSHPDERIEEALETRDGLFVKNLENVQGDERDTILFSVAFSANDKGVVPLNFGPLTNAGGERRLNVAITRARREVVLYTSFDPGDLRTENTVSVGIKHLRSYLELAGRGAETLGSGGAGTRRVDRHREGVAQALRDRGLVVATEVGLSEFRVDISVAKPEDPGQPLLAILLDGESWRDRETVSDRDGLPVEVLANLMQWPGVERVWLPEWLTDQEGTLDRLTLALEAADARWQAIILAETEHAEAARDREFVIHPAETDVDDPGAPVEPAPSREIDLDDELARIGAGGEALAVRSWAEPVSADRESLAAPAMVGANSVAASPRGSPPEEGELGAYTPWEPRVCGDVDVLNLLPQGRARSQVTDVIEEIVEAEGPILAEQLGRLVGEAFGLGRVAKLRQEAIGRCVPKDLQRTEWDQFIWPRGTEPETYRRARLPADGERRDLDHVSLYEITNVMTDAVQRAGGIGREDLQRHTLAAFGGKRMTGGITARLDAAVAHAVANGRIEEVDGQYVTMD